VTKLQKLLSDAEEYFNTLETEDAPSGEWEEYNVDWLREEAYVTGIRDAVAAVGSCDTCGFSMSSGRGEDYRDCKKGNGIHKKDWYCADFQRGYCDDCVHAEAMDHRLWCNIHKKAVEWDDMCDDFEMYEA
jgi:hypothetical protein